MDGYNINYRRVLKWLTLGASNADPESAFSLGMAYIGGEYGLKKEIKNLIIEEKDEILYDKTLDIPILQISYSSNKIVFDTNITKITGAANNLKNLGWTPKKSIGYILDEILDI
jgi:hypothetical protein